jgi:hypothetical protein
MHVYGADDASVLVVQQADRAWGWFIIACCRGRSIRSAMIKKCRFACQLKQQRLMIDRLAEPCRADALYVLCSCKS